MAHGTQKVVVCAGPAPPGCPEGINLTDIAASVLEDLLTQDDPTGASFREWGISSLPAILCLGISSKH